MRLLRHLIQRRTTQFQVELAAALPPVWGDAQHLAHVVVNLVVNALEALPDTWGCACRRAMRPKSTAWCWKWRIKAWALRHSIWPVCAIPTTKAARGGTGLGLAITATLVHAHGGRLTFQSEPGQGTCVRVTLPTADSTLAAAAAHSAEAR